MTADPVGCVELRLPIGDNGFLRPLDMSDVTDAYIDGLNDPDVNHFMVAVRAQRQDAKTVKAYVASNMENENAILFGIFIDDDLRGTVRLHQIDLAAGGAHIGIALFDRLYWGNGWGSRALLAAKTYGLNRLGLDTIIGGIYASNTASQKSFTRAGFRHDPGRDEDGDIDRVLYWVARGAVGRTNDR